MFDSAANMAGKTQHTVVSLPERTILGLTVPAPVQPSSGNGGRNVAAEA